MRLAKLLGGELTSEIVVKVVVEDPERPRMAQGHVGKLSYEGFDPDVGEIVAIEFDPQSVRSIPVHEIERIEIVNADYWRRGRADV